LSRAKVSIAWAVAVAALVCACGPTASAPTPTPPAASEAPADSLRFVLAEPSATPTPAPPPEPTATPVPNITLAAGEVVRGNRERPELALTFDCGASGAPTPAILDALRAAGVRVTFFITGRWATMYPELTRRIAAEHEIANHSWSHPDFRELSNAQIVAQIQQADAALQAIAGAATQPLWRAPFGSRDNRILTAVRDAGWPYHIFWSADSGDWRDISPAEVRRNVGQAASNGAIIVQHCGSTQSAAVLGDILADLASRAFRVVSVSELLRD